MKKIFLILLILTPIIFSSNLVCAEDHTSGCEDLSTGTDCLDCGQFCLDSSYGCIDDDCPDQGEGTGHWEPKDGRRCCAKDTCTPIMGAEYSCMSSPSETQYECVYGKWYCKGVNTRCCKRIEQTNTPRQESETTNIKLTDPLGGISTPRLIGTIIFTLLGIVGSLSLIMFIYGGILWIISGGNEENVKKGKETLKWAIFGIVIVFASYGILNFVISIMPQ